MPDRPPPSLAPIQHYRVLDWCGHDLYQCNDCPFDTLDADIMRRHQEEFHGRAVILPAAQRKEMPR